MMGNNTNSTGGAISVDGADTLGQFFTNESQDDGFANYVSYTPSTPFYVNNFLKDKLDLIRLLSLYISINLIHLFKH